MKLLGNTIMYTSSENTTKAITRIDPSFRGGSSCCPTYQLHLPLKTRFMNLKDLSRDTLENSDSGFLFKNIGVPTRRPTQGMPGKSFWGSQWGILGSLSLADDRQPVDPVVGEANDKI